MESTHPLVSVIIIFLNEAKFLAEAIDSILAQTYIHWELHIVDDGATDGSSEIAQHYAAHYPDRINYLSHPGKQNRGQNAARNLGLSYARGEYIAFLDGDDVWLPNKLQEQLAIFQQHPNAAIVYGRTQIWYSWTGRVEDAHRDYFYPLGIKPNTLVKPPVLLVHLLRNTSQSPTTCNVILRKSVFDQIGLFDDNFRGMYEDLLFFIKVQLHLPIFVADTYWARYRRHPECCTFFLENLVEHTAQYCAKRRAFLNYVNQYLLEQKTKDLRIWLFLWRELLLVQNPRLLKWLILGKQFSSTLANRVIQRASTLINTST